MIIDGARRPRFLAKDSIFGVFAGIFVLRHWLGTRFERLLISEMLVRKLIDFNRHNIGALLGDDTAAAMAEILQTRLAATQQALLALKLQYPDYARDLQYVEDWKADVESRIAELQSTDKELVWRASAK